MIEVMWFAHRTYASNGPYDVEHLVEADHTLEGQISFCGKEAFSHSDAHWMVAIGMMCTPCIEVYRQLVYGQHVYLEDI